MVNSRFLQCIEACQQCTTACDVCSVACLEENNVAEMARCIKLDMECAAICRTAVAAMARESEFCKAICQLCADICEACAAECRQHHHEHCQQCAQACENCAQACRTMAA